MSPGAIRHRYRQFLVAHVPEGLDVTGDGETDVRIRDTTGDGRSDTLVWQRPGATSASVAIDTTGDGQVDTVLVDATGDGYFDALHKAEDGAMLSFLGARPVATTLGKVVPAPLSCANEIEIPNGDDRFELFQRLLSNTFSAVKTRDRKDGSAPRDLLLVKAFEVRNEELMSNYEEAKAKLKERCEGQVMKSRAFDKPRTLKLLPPKFIENLDETIQEHMLFHGTSPGGAIGISSTGIQISKAAAGMYGRSLYFAECSSKSDEYASHDETGELKDCCAIMLCRVALGRVLYWDRDHNDQDLWATWKTGNWDSLLGDREKLRGTYREFVLPKESAGNVCPDYILIYRRVGPWS